GSIRRLMGTWGLRKPPPAQPRDGEPFANSERTFAVTSASDRLGLGHGCESALRTPGLGGFQLLDLHDFPGQGTALVGVLDPFWDSKPYVNPAEFRRFCGPTVPLARMTKRMWTSDETFAADVEVTHFGAAPLIGITPQWTVTCGKDEVAAGSLPTRDVPIGQAIGLGRIELPLSQFGEAAKLELTVCLAETESANDWDFWVYPARVDTATPDEVLEVDELNDAAVAHLQHGGRVILFADPRAVKTNVEIGFSSIFWNTAWTGGQPPHTLGILCDPNHPALAAFPTEYHTNWQWWELVSRSGAMVLDDLPTSLRPIVQVVPDWFTPQRLGLVFEAKVHAGKLLVCSIDLEKDLASRPVARQMRHTLLRYMASEAFDPQHDVAPEQVRDLFRELPTLQKLGAKVWADSQQRSFGAARAIDGDPATMWHTAWEPQLSAPPHWLALDLGKPVTLAGLTCLPRSGQDNGRIGAYQVYVSDDPERWGSPVATGQWKNDATLKTIRFDPPIAGRYVKLVALREIKDRSWSSLAEIDVLIAE
ncbi:MAG: discoidin domain-containing protein, partial [Planctomycetes bacterium]|nr:discoidin domain-containing protein [Planctomycetota bacterium]